MPLKELCTPRPSVFAADRRATVLSLDTFLKGEVDAGLALVGRTELRTLDPSVFVDREPGRNLPA